MVLSCAAWRPGNFERFHSERRRWWHGLTQPGIYQARSWRHSRQLFFDRQEGRLIAADELRHDDMRERLDEGFDAQQIVARRAALERLDVIGGHEPLDGVEVFGDDCLLKIQVSPARLVFALRKKP